MLTRSLVMAGNEWRRVWRKPASYIGILLAGVFLWAFLAHGVTTDFRHVPVAVFVEEESDIAAGYVQALEEGQLLKIIRCGTEEDLKDLFAKGEVVATALVPAEMSDGPSTVRLSIDGSELGLALHVRSVIAQITGRYASGLANVLLQEGGQLPEAWPVDEPLIRVETTIPFSPSLDGRDYGLVSMAAPVICILLIGVAALSVVSDKESGRMDMYRLSDVSTGEFVLGRCMPYSVLGFALTMVIVTASALELEVGAVDRVPLALLAAFPYILGCAFAGLAVSAWVRTSARALEVCVLLALPVLFLSGFFFPVEQMPAWGQIASFFVPSRHLNSLFRLLLLRREGLMACWPQVTWGFGFLAVAYGLSWYTMRRELRRVL